MPPDLQIHRQAMGDVAFLLNKVAPTSETIAQRARLHLKLRKLVISYAGNDFDVEDMSICVYAMDLGAAPFEFVIVDKRHPHGLPLGTDFEHLPDIYDPSQVASLLQSAGFDGVTHPINALRRAGPGSQKGKGPSNATLCEEELAWSKLDGRSQSNSVSYPAVLEARSPVMFNLSLPAPLLRHTINFLRTHSRIFPRVPATYGLLYLWMRSWGIRELSAITAYIMFIRFLQDTYKLTPLQVQVSGSRQDKLSVHAKVWMPFSPTATQAIEPAMMGVSYTILPKAQIPQNLVRVLGDFFRWFTGKNFHGLFLEKPRPIIRVHDPDIIASKYSEQLRSFNDSSFPWSRHQLIVADPFSPIQNHGFNVTRSTLHRLHQLAQTSANLLFTAHPLRDIFGSHWAPAGYPYDSEEQFSRDEVPSMSTLSLSTAGTVPPPRSPFGSVHGQRRMYSTNVHFGLKADLQRLYETSIPHPSVHNLRAQTLMRVSQAIQRRYGRQYRVELFGSTRYGVDSSNSDLDLVVIDPDRLDGFAPHVDLKTLPEIYDIYKMGTTLRQANFRILRNIPKAAVPIVKFQDPYTGLFCDININGQLGILNTELISHYCDLLPILRPLILAIKSWAKPLGYNSPSRDGEPTSFSSYALTLMTIGLLQTRGVLPNLQDVDDFVQIAEQSEFWLRGKAGQRLKCDVRWARRDGWQPPHNVGLDEALADWFHYWGHEHDYSASVMSIRAGGIIPRQHPAVQRKPFGFPGNVPFGVRSTGHDLLSLLVADQKDFSEARQGRSVASDIEEPEEPVQKNIVQLSTETSAPATGTSLEEAPPSTEIVDVEVPLSSDDPDAQPSSWAKDPICVADPFIRTKNATGPINYAMMARFRADCQRVNMMLRWDSPIDALMKLDEQTEPLPQARPRPFRGRGRGQGPAGRGNGDSGAEQLNAPPSAGRASTSRGRGQSDLARGIAIRSGVAQLARQQ